MVKKHGKKKAAALKKHKEERGHKHEDKHKHKKVHKDEHKSSHKHDPKPKHHHKHKKITKAKAKVEKVMHEFKHHELHSGSKKGPVVSNPKQAIAIALSESRKAKRK